MSLDSINKITEAEEAARRLKHEAHAKARAAIEAAEAAGAESVLAAKREAEAEIGVLRARLEEKAAQYDAEQRDLSLARRAAIRAKAEAKLDAAAAIIVSRITDGDR